MLITLDVINVNHLFRMTEEATEEFCHLVECSGAP
jgi:hypothetical protein